jgi:carbon-monoxide dehydrogenase small subunit
MNRLAIGFRLNGVAREVEVEPGDTLLEMLRDRLGIKSPKTGCDRGDCGACTVFLDGRTVRSCLVLAAEADGCDVVTLEGIAQIPGPLLRELAGHNSFQCGFCAPGVVLSALELLLAKPHPTRLEIQEAIAGNLCRCTGYTSIIEGIKAACGADAARDEAGPGGPAQTWGSALPIIEAACGADARTPPQPNSKGARP